MSDLTRLTIAEARDGLADKKFSALELTDSYLATIETANPRLNAYVTVTADKARAMAQASDDRLASKSADTGSLEGIPLGIKDLFATRGVHTQAASHILDGFEPRYESTVTQNLWDAGAVMLGKLNMDEFAMGSSNETSYYGPVINPWRARGRNADLVPGGSSGGSASAVAAWLCAGATATDTGGSIRQPAALTGTVGIKPTYGRCSRWGIVAFASSLDQAGPIARDVRDVAGDGDAPRARVVRRVVVRHDHRRLRRGHVHDLQTFKAVRDARGISRDGHRAGRAGGVHAPDELGARGVRDVHDLEPGAVTRDVAESRLDLQVSGSPAEGQAGDDLRSARVRDVDHLEARRVIRHESVISQDRDPPGGAGSGHVSDDLRVGGDRDIDDLETAVIGHEDYGSRQGHVVGQARRVGRSDDLREGSRGYVEDLEARGVVGDVGVAAGNLDLPGRSRRVGVPGPVEVARVVDARSRPRSGSVACDKNENQ